MVEIRGAPTAGSAWVGAGIAAQLERDGITTRVSPDLGFAYGPDRVLGDEKVRLVVLPVEDPSVAATRDLPCFEDAGRVEKYTLFLGDADLPQSRMKSTSQSPVSANSGWSRLRRMQSSSTSVSISVRMKHR